MSAATTCTACNAAANTFDTNVVVENGLTTNGILTCSGAASGAAGNVL